MESTGLTFYPQNKNHFIKRIVFWSPTFQTSNKTLSFPLLTLITITGVMETNLLVSQPAIPEMLASAACTTAVYLFFQGSVGPMLCRIPAGGEESERRVLTDAKDWLHTSILAPLLQAAMSIHERSVVIANVFSEFVQGCEFMRVSNVEPQG